MATTTTSDMLQVIEMLEGADSVELKLTVPEGQQRSSVAALGLDPLDAQIRQVFFFDTPDLALFRAGVVARARRVQRAVDDSVVKLRPVVPSELPAKLRASPNLGVEVDAMPGSFVCSASMKAKLKAGPVREAAAGNRPIRKLFTKEQRTYFAAHAPEGIAWEDLSILGPINVLKLRYVPKGSAQKFVAEMWFYPDGSRVLELSTKTVPGSVAKVVAESRSYLLERGIDLSGAQETKTRKALGFFAKGIAPAE